MLKNLDGIKKLDKIMKSLNYGPLDYNMWEGGVYGIYMAIRRIFLKIVLSK